MPIQAGQTFRSLSTRHHPVDGPTRIKVCSNPVQKLDGGSKVRIVTLTKHRREIRPRWIDTSQLHLSAGGAWGKPRRTGYVLEADQ